MPAEKAGEIRGFAGIEYYIQGPDAVRLLPQIVKKLGSGAFVLMGASFYDSAERRFRQMFREAEVPVTIEKFGRECSEKEIARVEGLVDSMSEPADVVVGFGGGKTLDTARVVAARGNRLLIAAPTSAATNAAASGMSVVYNDRHEELYGVQCNRPDYVVVDTEYLIQGPARMLAAGIADALSTYIEARNVWRTNHVNSVQPGYCPTICGRQMARACYDTLLAHGERAYLAAQHTLRTDSFEEVVEAITLLSGVGWENNGCSVAHALASALSVLEDTRPVLHGECVAFCILVQIILDREDWGEFQRVYRFCKSLGLPVNLDNLGIIEGKNQKIERVAHLVFETQKTIQVVNYELNPTKLKNAMLFLDELYCKMPDALSGTWTKVKQGDTSKLF